MTATQQFQLFMMGRMLLARPKVLSVRGVERANGLYEFDVRFVVQATEDLVADNSLLEQPVHLQVFGGETPRHIHGVVESIAVVPGSFEQRTIFEMRIGPQLGALRWKTFSRIFTDKTALEIITAVLNEYRVPFRLRVKTTYPKRAYTVQYQETDYAFVMRLASDEGIITYFDHPSSEGSGAMTNMGASETLVITDSAESYAPTEGTSTLMMAMDSDALIAADTHVFSFTARRTPRPTMTLERAYDYQKPPVELRDSANVQTGGPPHIFYAFGGSANETPPEIVAAAIRLDQERADAFVGTAESACMRLMPGRTFTLEGHDLNSLCTNYVVTEVHHTAHAAEVAPAGAPVYRNTFTCVPASVPIRPARVLKPPVHGMETAVVVGPEGKEIHVDADYRVQVQFHWDLAGKKDGATSTWLRVKQPWAGAAYGFQWVPRIGMEVAVSFLGGDLDRPLVDGCVFNKTHPVPFMLPDRATVGGIKTQSTPGGGGENELSFDDAKGKELVYMRAERDRKALVQNDDEERVGHDQRGSVGHDRICDVGERDLLTVGKERTEQVTGSQTGSTMSNGTISSSTGAATFTLSGGDATLKAAGNISMSAGGKVDVSAGGEVYVTAPVVVVNGDATVVITAGANVTIKADGPVTIKGAVVTDN